MTIETRKICRFFQFGPSRPAKRALLILVVGFTIAACTAGSGEGLDISGRPLSEGGNVPLAPNLASIQVNVFNPSCIVCHAGAAAPQGLRLDAANSFANLVGVASREVSSVLRVAPGNPNQSYLIQKLEGNAQVGERMPLGGPPLPQATIDFIRQWITDGAQPQMVPSANAPVVVSVSPDFASLLTDSPTQVLVSFDQEIDASTINEMTILLLRSGGDGRFDDGNEDNIVATSIELSYINSRQAVMDLSGVLLTDDDYQIIVYGSGPSIVLNLNGAALDGEFAGNFPSGDGNDGGDFSSTFTIRRVQPTLTFIQENIFTPICSGCHAGPAGPELPSGMNLTSEVASLRNIVNVPSLGEPLLMRVVPGDVDASYLLQKLEGTAASGDRMPQGGPFLEQNTIDAFRQWVNDGANP